MSAEAASSAASLDAVAAAWWKNGPSFADTTQAQVQQQQFTYAPHIQEHPVQQLPSVHVTAVSAADPISYGLVGDGGHLSHQHQHQHFEHGVHDHGDHQDHHSQITHQHRVQDQQQQQHQQYQPQHQQAQQYQHVSAPTVLQLDVPETVLTHYAPADPISQELNPPTAHGIAFVEQQQQQHDGTQALASEHPIDTPSAVPDLLPLQPDILTHATSTKPRKVRPNEIGLTCKKCGTQDTILWRYKFDPENGPLCNSCGLKHQRKLKATNSSNSDDDLSASQSGASRKRKRGSAGSTLGETDTNHQSALDAARVLAKAVAEAAFGQILPHDSLSGDSRQAATETTPRRRGPGNMTLPKKVVGGYTCRDCGVTEASLWRYKTHVGVGPLCNPCGLKHFRKLHPKNKDPDSTTDQEEYGESSQTATTQAAGLSDGSIHQGTTSAFQSDPALEQEGQFDGSAQATAAVHAQVSDPDLPLGSTAGTALELSSHHPVPEIQLDASGLIPPPHPPAAAIPLNGRAEPALNSVTHRFESIPQLDQPALRALDPNSGADGSLSDSTADDAALEAQAQAQAQAAQEAVEGFFESWEHEAARGAVEAVTAAAVAAVHEQQA